MNSLVESNIRTHYRACNLCEAICGLEIKIGTYNEILTIKGDEKDPFSKGHICPKAIGLKDIYLDPNRLKTPVKRTKNGWESIDWDQALNEVVNNLKNIQAKYGNDSVASYSGNPSAHNSGTLLAGAGFLRALNSKNRFTATSADQLPHHFVGWAMFGHHMTLPIPDIDHTHYWLIIGGNPLASNGSMMTAPDINNRLRNIQKRGGKVVVIDPRKTETAKHADQHIFIKPATDVYFLLAILNIILSKKEFVKEVHFNLENIESFNKNMANYTAKSVSKVTGVAESVIHQIANEILDAKTAVVYGRMGVSTQAFGGMCQWLINLINIATGNFDKQGGAMFTSPAFSLYGAAKKGFNPIGRWHTKVRNLPEFDSELPVSAMAEELLHTDGPKAFVCVSGNPALSTPNGKQLEKALERLEFMVSIDIYINETSKYANIILPPTTGLEISLYDLVFNALAVRNTAKYSEPTFEKHENQRHDWEIFESLKNKMLSNPITEKPQNPEVKIDFMLKNGEYASEGMSLEKLKANPHGIDLGPLKPSIKENLFTENGKINLFPTILMADFERVNRQMPHYEKISNEDLLLIGRRHLRSNNSWMHNSERLIKGRNRCTVMMHPETAKFANITNEEIVKIESLKGNVKIAAEITDDIMPGVLSIPHGYGHGGEGVILDIANAHAGVSINDLTDDSLIDTLTGNAAFSGVPVWLKKIENN